MGETIINNFMIGTIQNGSFIPIGKMDNVKAFEEENNLTQEENVFHMHVTDDISFKFECKFSRKSHRAIELMCLFGWRNKMPFRKRLLMRERAKLYKYYIYNTLNLRIEKVMRSM